MNFDDVLELRNSQLCRGDNSDSWLRNLAYTNEIKIEDFSALQNNGIVKVNSSGSNRPLIGESNSYYSNGKLIYDVSNERVKGFKINVDPEGIEHYQPYKLKGSVPEEIKKLFGW